MVDQSKYQLLLSAWQGLGLATDTASKPYKALRWPKAWGSKPSNEAFEAAHAICARPGAKHALACAMYLRAGEGATTEQVQAAAQAYDKLGAAQGALLNYMRRACEQGLVWRDVNAPKGNEGGTVYLIAPTARGVKVIEAYRARVASQVKPVAPTKATPKAAKARKRSGKAKGAVVPAEATLAAPAETPISEAPTVNEGLLVETSVNEATAA